MCVYIKKNYTLLGFININLIKYGMGLNMSNKNSETQEMDFLTALASELFKKRQEKI